MHARFAFVDIQYVDVEEFVSTSLPDRIPYYLLASTPEKDFSLYKKFSSIERVF
jgi:hypothetical protein